MQKARPVVVVSADAINLRRRTVIIVPLSSGPTPQPPINVPIPSAGMNSVAKCDQIRVVDKARLSRFSGRLSDEDLAAVVGALAQILVIPSS